MKSRNRGRHGGDGTGLLKENIYRERRTVNSVLVYRLDIKTKSMVPLGILVDRRNHERGDNVIAMLRMARREFAGTDEEAASIFIKYEAGAADAG